MIHLNRNNWVAATDSQLDAIHIMDSNNYTVENYDEGWIRITVPQAGSDMGDFAIFIDRLRHSFRQYRMLSVSTEEIVYTAQLGAHDEHEPTVSTWRSDWEKVWATEGKCECGDPNCDGSCEDAFDELRAPEG